MTRQVDSDQEFVLIYSFFTGRSSQREAVMIYMNPQAFVVLIPQNNEGILHRPCRKHLLHTLCMLPCCLPLLSPSLFHWWINATVLFTSFCFSVLQHIRDSRCIFPSIFSSLPFLPFWCLHPFSP